MQKLPFGKQKAISANKKPFRLHCNWPEPQLYVLRLRISTLSALNLDPKALQSKLG